MTPANQKYRDALLAIECVAAAALANQPHDDVECEKHLLSALGKIGGMLVQDSILGEVACQEM